MTACMASTSPNEHFTSTNKKTRIIFKYYVMASSLCVCLGIGLCRRMLLILLLLDHEHERDSKITRTLIKPGKDSYA